MTLLIPTKPLQSVIYDFFYDVEFIVSVLFGVGVDFKVKTMVIEGKRVKLSIWVYNVFLLT